MSAAREQHLREFESDGPEKVRENVSLNRYDRRTLARAILWLDQRRSRAVPAAGRYKNEAATSITPRNHRHAKTFPWFALAAAAVAIVVAAALTLGR